MSREREAAEKYFEQALETSRAVGLEEGVAEARSALKRLRSCEKA